ncbi:hypothetical protein Tco_0550312 [Tanacetum coccineum]
MPLANPLAGEVSGAVRSTWRASTLDLRAQCVIAPCALRVQDSTSEETTNKKNRKSDAKALFFIQQAVDETIFSRIAAAKSAKEAWDTLKTEYQGSAKVITVKLQFLRRDFESAVMKSNETVQTYLARVSGIVRQMRAYGDKVADEIVVAKIQRSLSFKSDHVVAAIEESKDLSTGNKQSSHIIVVEDEVVLEEEDVADQAIFNAIVAKSIYGHIEDDCWSKDTRAQYAATTEDEDYLFMTYLNPQVMSKDVWYLDSACSNHMTGD